MEKVNTDRDEENRPRGKYASKMRTDGRYYLVDTVDELICHLTVQGEDEQDIIRLVKESADAEIDVARIEAVKSTILGQRRMMWLEKEKKKDDMEPETPEECLSFAKNNLIRMIKSPKIEVKDKITANKTLVEVALKEREMSKGKSTKMVSPALQRLLDNKKAKAENVESDG